MPYLMTSASPATSSRRGSVRKHGDIDEHQLRLIEGTDQILSIVVIDPGLAADAGVHLGEQRGRHLHVGNAAQISRRGKAGEIADHAATKREHAGFSLQSFGDQAIVDRCQRFKIFMFFAVGHENRRDVESGSAQRFVNRVEIKLRHRRIADDATLPRNPACCNNSPARSKRFSTPTWIG